MIDDATLATLEEKYQKLDKGFSWFGGEGLQAVCDLLNAVPDLIMEVQARRKDRLTADEWAAAFIPDGRFKDGTPAADIVVSMAVRNPQDVKIRLADALFHPGVRLGRLVATNRVSDPGGSFLDREWCVVGDAIQSRLNLNGRGWLAWSRTRPDLSTLSEICTLIPKDDPK